MPEPLRTLRRRLRSDAGMGLVEVVVAAAVFLLVAGTALTTLTAAEVTTKGSQIQEGAVAIAQREIERLRQNGYAALGLASAPAGAAAGADVNPTNPNEYVSGGRFRARTNFHDRNSALAPHVPANGEPFFTVASGGVAPGPEQVTSGSATYNVYRYVTRVDMVCMVGADDKCPGTEDAKRIVVAVSPVTRTGQRGPVKPVWVSSILANPAAIVAGATPPPPVSGASNQTAQPFSLYDTVCNQSTRQPIAGSHAVHDTVGLANCAAGTGARLDLMGPVAPPATDPPPTLYDYSTDAAARTSPSGRALQRPAGGADCAGSYVTALAGKHTMHRWASTPMPSGGFTSGTRSAMSVITKTSGGATGEATLCAALHKLSTLGALSAAISPIVSHRIAPNWPASATEVAFAFNHSAFSLAGGERLVLAVWLAGTSLPEGVELLYDHQQADSVLSVSTTTPLS
jgi:type II secretory pathway pseudopilin PulG